MARPRTKNQEPKHLFFPLQFRRTSGLTHEVIRAAGLEVGLGRAVAVVSGEGTGLRIPYADGSVAVIHLCGQPLVERPLEEFPGQTRVVV
jgi:hypothetical protein